MAGKGDKITISKSELIDLVKDAFNDAYNSALNNYYHGDAWRYSDAKKQIEKLTNEEYIDNEW